MKSFIAKRVISILVNLRYWRYKLLKYKENNKKICNTFDLNFKNVPLYIMSNVSLERYYFVLYDGAFTLKMSKMALNAFCDKTLHIQILYTCFYMYSVLSLMSFDPLPRAYLPPEHTSTYPRIPPPAPCSPCIQQQQQQRFHPQKKKKRTWSMGTLTLPHLSAYPSQLQTRKGSEQILDAILHQPRNSPSYLLSKQKRVNMFTL